MPEEKKSSTPLKFELFEIQKAVEEIRDAVETIKPKSKPRQLLDALLVGIFRGLGFIIGATLLAGIVFLLLKNLLETAGFENWIGEQLQEIISRAIDRTLP